ncbi:MAG TPA: hypothetical protein VNP73_04760, partial [Actinomycetota bacterium]|nr:hypothetical protein [Actinomycetota bacterium]
MLEAAFARIGGRNRISIGLLLLAFIVTRFLGASGAVGFGARTDVEIAYRHWAVTVVERDQVPYAQVNVEYPPGSLPFVLAPQLTTDTEHSYRVLFVSLMVLVDALGLLGLMVLSRRNGSMLGPWMWVVGLWILGPFIFLRLDLVPAVATIWAMERATNGKWGAGGALLGFGAIAKLYPLIILPVLFIMAPREAKKRVLIGAGAVAAVFLAPFLLILPDVFNEVIGYHSKRGIQIESLWGSLLYVARSGTPIKFILHNYGAHHFEGGSTSMLKAIAGLATIGAVSLGAWVAHTSKRLPENLAGICFATLTLTVAVASVLSPQFFVWVVALAAVALCWPKSPVQLQAAALLFILLLTRLIYPMLH